ncbi:hypothetical protein [Pedobacter nanyangensis]|uniref:hypothetical protein n=1 Tax=Pedobacter nanyangensis TaxID=1562389 RepID=UPI000DE38EF6|nr:hypothetical protein [Pedobacter nanyangensis]
MEKLIIIIFYSEETAIEASRAIEQLALNKDIAIAELYILSKNEQGNVTVRDAKNQEIFHSEINNSLAGNVISILGDPLNALAGLTTGTSTKGISNLLGYNKTSKMLKKASRIITAGKIAIVAHIDEYWEIPLNMALEPFDVNITRLNINDK